MHMAAARLGCKRTMVGTGWANSRPGCMSRLRKHYSHLSGGSFLASWALSRCLPTESASCSLMSGHGQLRSRVCLLSLKVHLSSFLSQNSDRKKIWCVTGVCNAKVVASETNLGVKGLKGLMSIQTVEAVVDSVSCTRGSGKMMFSIHCLVYSVNYLVRLLITTRTNWIGQHNNCTLGIYGLQ